MRLMFWARSILRGVADVVTPSRLPEHGNHMRTVPGDRRGWCAGRGPAHRPHLTVGPPGGKAVREQRRAEEDEDVRILVVEDAEKLARALKSGLEAEG